MHLSQYLKPMTHEARIDFALQCGTTFAHLKNVAWSGKTCGIELAVQLELRSGGAVKRWECRPDDWHRIWPELIGAPGAPAVEVEGIAAGPASAAPPPGGAAGAIPAADPAVWPLATERRATARDEAEAPHVG